MDELTLLHYEDILDSLDDKIQNCWIDSFEENNENYIDSLNGDSMDDSETQFHSLAGLETDIYYLYDTKRNETNLTQISQSNFDISVSHDGCQHVMERRSNSPRYEYSNVVDFLIFFGEERRLLEQSFV